MPLLSVPPFFSAFLALALAGFVFFKNPRSAVNRVFALLCFQTFWWQACWFATYFFHEPSQKDLIIRISWIGVVFIPFTYYEFSVRFLGLNSELKWTRWAYIFASVFLVLTWTGKLFIAGINDFWWGYYTKAGILHPLYLTVVSWVLLRAVFLLWRGWQDPNLPPIERHRRRFAFFSHFIYVLAAFEYAINYGVPLYPIGVISMPTAFCVSTYAMFRHQFMDIRIVIRKSLVYSLLVACITASYLVVVLVMEKWFQGFFGYRSILATAAVAFLIAIFFNPLRDRIQAFVDRALFKATTPELASQREQLLVEVRKGEQMKAVATLAAGLAHEIKNPLASIKTFTESLDGHYSDPEFRKKFKRIVGGEVERINLIVQQLLEFAKPVPPKLMPLEVAQVVDDTLEFLGGEFVKRQVAVNRRYDAKVRILGDPQQLKQVFLNLVLNSLDAMNGHGKLDVQTAVEGSDLVASIADNGSGIAPKDLPHVFEPFYTTKSNGTGLGLAVVHGIVKEHGGRIQIQSQAGQGTTMRLYLPIAI